MRKIVLKVDRKHSALQNTAITIDQGKQQTVFILLFAVLYLFRDLGGANIPDVVFSGLCAVAFILSDMGTCLGMYIFTSSLTAPHNEIRLVYCAIILAKLLLSGKVQLNARMFLMTLGVMFLQILNMTIFSAKGVGDLLYDYITRMLIIILPLFWYNDEYSAEDLRSALLCYVAGVILGGTVTLILTAERVTWEALLKGTGGVRLGKTYNTEEGMQTTYNANQLGIMCAIAAAILLQHIDKNRMLRMLGIALLGFLLFLVILTRSRTSLLMMVLVVLVYYFVIVVRRKKLLQGIFFLGAAVAIALIVSTFIPELTEAVLGRFVDQEDITNGRADLFADYIRIWVNDPWCFFFGYGIGSYGYMVDTWNSPHNAITDILICWGISGFLLVSGILRMCYAKGIKGIQKKNRIMAVLPAIVALAASMTGQYLTTGYPHMRLCFLLLAAKAWENSDAKQKELVEENGK